METNKKERNKLKGIKRKRMTYRMKKDLDVQKEEIDGIIE